VSGPPLVLLPGDPRAADPALAGGKGAQLRRLAGWGQTVPPWYTVSTAAFAAALEGAGLAVRLAAEADPEAEAELRRRIAELELPPELAAALAAAHAAVHAAGAAVAVRSSAAGEDAAGESFAGLHESFLFVRGLEETAHKLRRVWASAFSERALAYRRAKGISLADIRVAVVVQEMVDARSSGVLFTADPADPTAGAVHNLVVSALWGAGEGLVSAGLDADTFRVDKQSGEVTAVLAHKAERLVHDLGAGGLRREAVPDELRDRPSLEPETLSDLARRGLDLERRWGRPLDVEFAVDARARLFLLQARPVTTVEELGPAAGNRALWDNSNIVESYSGVTSPMTFSFIRRAYAIVYHCFAEVMGIPARTVRAQRHVFENMLGLFRGQVYYNLHNWYRLVRLFPGFEYNRAFMESMMGVKQSAHLDEEDGEARTGTASRASGSLWGRSLSLVALLRLVLRSAWNFARIRRLVSRFQAHFAECYERWSALDLGALAPHEHLRLYREMEEQLLWRWKAPIVNDFFVMVFYGTLKRLCAAWCGDASGSLQNDLLCGEGGIESTEPTKALLRLAAEARRDPGLAALLRERPAEDNAALLPGDPRFPEFAAGIARYLELYGLRCMNELKLEEPTLRDDPRFLYRVLANYVSSPDPAMLDVAAMEGRERDIRRAAEARALAALSPLRRPVFRWVLGNARLGVKNRENLRFARTRIYGLLRQLLRSIGERFAQEGILRRPDDVFFLTLDEVWGYVQGAAVTADLQALADLRRREFDAYRSEAERFPDDRFETFGLPYHRNRFRARRPPAAAGAAVGLRGVACCPGVVEGPVKVVRSPQDDVRLQGEILVAERTDPGWVPLYPSASGLLIERGSILSHSAIVAREMGLPTIVGIPGLVSTLRTGERVRMDGAAGTVERLD
jgi:pyruvate,water dikinase